ncbi:MAG TPA: sensor histidine kinase [Gemmatimonadaceae bacterium]|nr:sensor histidine kinase [Gemmatimonadaceae bacterium]
MPRSREREPSRAAARRLGWRVMRLTGLRAPLGLKLIGAYCLTLAGVVAFFTGAPHLRGSIGLDAAVLLGALLIFALLATIALRPLRSLEAVVSRVWRGDFGARVAASPVADRDLKRIAGMFNLLLDRLTADRAQMHELASSVIEAGDRERAALARELHDSTAQQLAALMLQLSAAARDSHDPGLAARLQQMRDQANDILEEVRLLSHTVHPRVLDDLGLPAALRKLAREAAGAGGGELAIDVVTGGDVGDVPPVQAAVLYRVAQAAIHNVLKHAGAHRAEMHLSVADGDVALEVVDDGRGFDAAQGERRRPGMGLFTMRERVSLAGGRFDVRSEPGAGTRIRAVLPLAPRLSGTHLGALDEQ